MIDFDFDRYCYGCFCCEQTCPTKAIRMTENEEGFLVPRVDKDKCIQCGRCDSNCAYLNPAKNRNKLEKKCYAFYGYRDEKLLLKSASGGVFPALAKQVLSEGGCVCGCVWDENMKAVHIVSDQWEDVKRMLHSKYTQSEIGSCYPQVRENLDKGRKVLVTGTPCQIAGILNDTGNPDNLFTCEVVCKGVPSPGVWHKYVSYLEAKHGSRLKSVVLRSKHRFGWTGPVTRYVFENGKVHETLFFQLNHYIVGFLDGLYMRGSCYHCQYKDEHHEADIVLGDFWGIDKTTLKKSQNKGISAVVINTPGGAELIEKIRSDFQVTEVTYRDMVARNRSMTDDQEMNPNRDRFFAHYKDMPIKKNIVRNTDLNSPRKWAVRIAEKTGVFAVYKWWKSR